MKRIAILAALAFPAFAQSPQTPREPDLDQRGGGGTMVETHSPIEAEADADPRALLEEVRQAYRSGALTERLLITLASEKGVERADLEFQRAEDGALTLVFHPLALRVEPAQGRWRAHAARTDGATAILRRELDPGRPRGSLDAMLPPLPAPQLDFALAERGELSNVTPWARDIRWTRAALRPLDEPPTAAVFGATDERDIEIVINLDTRRLKHVAIESREGGARLDIDVKPIEGDEPIVDESVFARPRAQEVSTFAELLEARADERLRPPDILFFDSTGRPWRLRDESAEGMALGIVRAGSRDPVVLHEALRLAMSRRDLPLAARIAVTLTPAQMTQLAGWSSAIGADLLWTIAVEDTIDRLAPESDAVVLVIDEQGVLRATIDLAGVADEVEMVAEEISATLRQKGREQGAER